MNTYTSDGTNVGMIGHQIRVLVKEARDYRDTRDMHSGPLDSGEMFDAGYAAAIAQIIVDMGFLQWAPEKSQDTIVRFLAAYDNERETVTDTNEICRIDCPCRDYRAEDHVLYGAMTQ